MAAGGPVQELCEEATCPICLEYFRDPVMIAECGHNFCRACLARSWGESPAEASCPQCRGTAQPGDLRPNRQLANFVEIIKKLGPLEGKEAEAEGAEGTGGVCEKHRAPLELFCKDDEAPLCVVCGRSKEHRDHEVIPLEEASQEKEKITAARKERVCKKHQQPLKLFCKDDEALICVVSDRSKEHQGHEILLLDEASQEYKKQTKEEKQAIATKFRQLHMFLEEQEELLLAQMEEVQEEVAIKTDKHLVELCEALSSLESLIQVMEEKIQQPATELLQDVRSTLQRYEEKETLENLLTFPLSLKWKIWDLCDLNLFLEGVMKQFKDTLTSGLQLQKAKVTLDLNTANRKLVLSQDCKSIRWENKGQDLPDNPERFEKFGIVLGLEGFTAGRRFWEVLVGSEGAWIVGVARKSVRRKKGIIFSPEEGIWAVGKWGGHYRIASEPDYCPLTLTKELQRIRVCLNYGGGQVTFFDADTASPLWTFSETYFSAETLHPLFWVHLKGHLQLSS
ncbi:E3 ubiquitin-protein ligase TRIM39-like [Eublepharis macularius]|uniref:E3 ubiquitin-protein ligase TRIM39-like n=1 Tax=Eublepharis macularius TaxID=481883 RepID=A0AA97JB23_EUBMA|nr:E3 ubiquitin-protein ligase TRIM39-like [Eublepharis macularius]